MEHLYTRGIPRVYSWRASDRTEFQDHPGPGRRRLDPEAAAAGLGRAAGDVEAEAGRAAAAAPALDRAAGSSPGPASATVTSAPPAARGRTATPNAVPSGVWAKTLPSRASTAAPRSAAGDADRQRAGGQVDGDRAALLLGQHRPEAHPLADDRGRVAAGAQRPRGRGRRASEMTSSMPRLTASTSSSSRSRSAGGSASTSSRSAVSGRAQPVRQVGGGLALGGQQLADPSGQPVHRRRRPRAPPAGPAGVARAVRSPLPEPVRGRRQVGDRPGQRAGQPVGDEQRQQQQDDAEPAEHQPGAGHARRAARSAGTKTSITAVPSARRTGCSSRVPSVALDRRRARRDVAVGQVAGVAEPGAVGPAHRHASGRRRCRSGSPPPAPGRPGRPRG